MEFSTNCFRISSGSELVQYMSSDANQSLRVSRGISEESVEMKYASLVHVWVGMGGVERGWFNAPGASQMQAQLNTLTDAYGRMETIKLTPIPVAHL